MLNGEVFEGGVASDFKMILGKGSMIAGFNFSFYLFNF
jgi:trigger factor